MAPARAELMERALEEAERGRGRTRPNPMVGCVVARGGKVIAVGHHATAGSPHAEVAALRRAGRAARGADVYVTLEPCDHHGRTGPCTEALVAAGVKRVFVGVRDPNPIVNGRGIRKLRRAGIEVQVGLQAAACRRLNEAFEVFIKQHRPFVHAKIAQSLDGRVATRTGESKWITGEKARKRGHQLRNWTDGILVGIGTVLADDPQLTCRFRGGRDPVRVVLDTQARTPPDARLIKVVKRSSAPTWIVVGPGAPRARRAALDRAGAETFQCKITDDRIDLDDLLSRLAERELLSLLVEGGPTVMGSFFDRDLVDKVHAFVAPMVIGGEHARASVGADGAARLSEGRRLVNVEVTQLGVDLLLEGYPKRSKR